MTPQIYTPDMQPSKWIPTSFSNLTTEKGNCVLIPLSRSAAQTYIQSVNSATCYTVKTVQYSIRQQCSIATLLKQYSTPTVNTATLLHFETVQYSIRQQCNIATLWNSTVLHSSTVQHCHAVQTVQYSIRQQCNFATLWKQYSTPSVNSATLPRCANSTALYLINSNVSADKIVELHL